MIDLHLHTTFSDGTRTPNELVKVAAPNFSAIAITDHDTIGGIKEGLEAVNNSKHDLLVIPGVELSCEYLDREVHILGYGIDYESSVLIKTLKELEQDRLTRIKMTTEKLTNSGFPLTYEQLPVTGLPGRAHVARAMVEKGYVQSVDQAFKDYLNPGKPGYVARNKLTPNEAVNLIHKARGIAILAHPGLIGLELSDNLLEKIPVDGIEVFHTAHKKEEMAIYEKFALERGLLISGGSDCHGPKGKDRELLGLIDLPEKYFAKLLAVMDGIA